MHGSASAGWLLLALCAGTGAYCLLRMRSGVEEQRRAAGADALMGFGMAAMALPVAVLAPPRWTWLLCAGVFGTAGLRAVWSARRDRHHLHHLVGACAMVYMSLVMAAAPGGHAGHMARARGGTPVLTGALLLYFTAHVLAAGARLVPAGAEAAAASAAWGDRPELARACRLSMSIAMLTMLVAL